MGNHSWIPKIMLPVSGFPLLNHHVRLFKAMGAEHLIIVVGQIKEKIEDYLMVTGGFDIDLELVEQTEPKGPGDALLHLSDRLDSPFALLLSDIFLVPNQDLATLPDPVLDGECDAVLAVAEETDSKRLQGNFRVDLAADGCVLRVVEKPSTAAPALKGCGLYMFNSSIFTALEQTSRSPKGMLGITEPIQTLIDLGRRVRPAAVSTWDINLTAPADLDICDHYLEQLEASNQKRYS
jgi:glucose-1-phosphate thymidylyltransferase